MKWIITTMLVFFLSISYTYGQEVKKIRVCDEPSVERYFLECSDAIESSSKREKKYYTEQCRTQAFTNFCEYKWSIITKKDTIFCDETKKKKYLKLCESCKD